MSSNKHNILFLNLYAFSLTGGVEKVCKNFVAALQQLLPAKQTTTLSMHDKPADLNTSANYKAYAGGRLRFAIAACYKAFGANTLIIAHINLLAIAKLISYIRPNINIIMFAHGIEVWKTLPRWKVKFLHQHTHIWAVSNYTRNQMLSLHNIAPQRITVLNNSLAPNTTLTTDFTKPQALLSKYNINPQTPVLFTLNRLASAERYKGYDMVIAALAILKKEGLNFTYLLAGKADQQEHQRITQLIAQHQLNQHVQLIGYVAPQHLTQHFLIADAFVMPSTGEGFGLVFIEAAAQGLQLIAGNQDGSTDALINGKLGQLVNPTNINDIAQAIKKAINNTNHQPEKQQQLALQHFGFNTYLQNIKKALAIT